MAKSEKQKLKLLYIADYLREYTDENHTITTQEIIDRLAREDISAERKSIYNDIAQLEDFGMDIVKLPSRLKGGYYLASREFELPELKLLVEAVSASKFVTREQSEELIRKLKKLTSKYEADKLQRQVHVVGRIKADNKKIFYSVDALHRAIQENKQISFQYMEWNSNKELVPRKDEKYVISPYALLWKEENYYLIGYDKKADCMKHYRVDKIKHAEVLDETREGKEFFTEENLPWYSRNMFGMYHGREETVTLEIPNSLVGVIIDRFGKEVNIRKNGENSILVRTDVVVSNQFFGWLAGIGKEVKLRKPENVLEEYRTYLKNILEEL